MDHVVTAVEDQIEDAIKAKDVDLLRTQLLSPPRLGIAVTDDFVYNMLLVQAHSTTSFDPQVCHLLCQSMSATLIQNIKDGSRDSPLGLAVVSGQVDVLKFLVNNFSEIFSIHQLYHGDFPLLFLAAIPDFRGLELRVRWKMCRFLVEKGADPNQICANGHRILDMAVFVGETDAVRLFLEFGANPSSSAAITYLLRDDRKTRDAKLAMCQVLMAHVVAQTNQAVADAKTRFDYLKTCLESAIGIGDIASCSILFEAGMKPGAAMYYAVDIGNSFICRTLVDDYNVDPFVVHHRQHDDDDNDTAVVAATAVSPFHAAAHKENVAIFEYFLSLWNARTFRNDGQQGQENYNALDIFGRDPLVSFQTIELLVQQYASRAAQKNAQGLYPFQIAVESDARLDVIFHLLKHSPDAFLQSITTRWLEPPVAENDRPLKKQRLV